ncbi:hypothetical protein [Pseudodesulfovibrio sp.]|uniref:hypothetical protein n=1 Tax=unclassified Pseudodesulfovibrio TaxID=2661612 RepID=UPI003B006C59
MKKYRHDDKQKKVLFPEIPQPTGGNQRCIDRENIVLRGSRRTGTRLQHVSIWLFLCSSPAIELTTQIAFLNALADMTTTAKRVKSVQHGVLTGVGKLSPTQKKDFWH